MQVEIVYADICEIESRRRNCSCGGVECGGGIECQAVECNRPWLRSRDFLLRFRIWTGGGDGCAVGDNIFRPQTASCECRYRYCLGLQVDIALTEFRIGKYGAQSVDGRHHVHFIAEVVESEPPHTDSHLLLLLCRRGSGIGIECHGQPSAAYDAVGKAYVHVGKSHSGIGQRYRVGGDGHEHSAVGSTETVAGSSSHCGRNIHLAYKKRQQANARAQCSGSYQCIGILTYRKPSRVQFQRETQRKTVEGDVCAVRGVTVFIHKSLAEHTLRPW